MSNARMNATREAMKKAGVDLLALGPGPHMKWMLGFHPLACERPCMLLMTQQKHAFLMPILNAEGSREQTDIAFYTYNDADGPQSALDEALYEIGATSAQNIALDETMRTDFGLLAMNAMPQAKPSLATDVISPLRMRKSTDEIEELRLNARLADEAMQAAYDAIKPGVTEAHVSSVIKDSFAKNGAEPLFAIVATGKNGAFPHHLPADNIINNGDAIVIDLGARIGTFSSDITRSVVVGDEPEGYSEVWQVVEDAVQAAIKASKPGARCKDVDKAARDVIEAAGYGEYFIHRTGHGLGVEFHEPPDISSSDDTILDVGMVYSIEPGIYLPGRFGIRLEETAVITNDGVEILGKISREAKRI